MSNLLQTLSHVDNLLRDTLSRRYYPEVILPLTLLRRLECTLTATQEAVLDVVARGITDDSQLRSAAGYCFYNTSPYTFPRLCADPLTLKRNLQVYLHGWSQNIVSLLQAFRFNDALARLDDETLLFLIIEQFACLDLHPDRVLAHEMGNLFEELLRQCWHSRDFEGEYFTPPDLADLMVRLAMGCSDKGCPRQVQRPATVYDPCCGTGRLLLAARDFGVSHSGVAVYGQELNPYSWALCRADLYLRGADDAQNIACGSTLADDQYAGTTFEYILANPPYGKSWHVDWERVVAEAKRGDAGRFGAGVPGKSDGQLLFLQHVLAHMKPVEEGGSRVAVVTNGAPLFYGDAGSGESEIRRWVLENDWLEAIIALPEAMFYNTGIATYLWLLTNCKSAERRGSVQCIDARDLWTSMRRSLGDKRRELSREQRMQIVSLYRSFDESEKSKICNTIAFGYRRVTVEQPLRCTFQVTPERIEELCDQPHTLTLLQVNAPRWKAWSVAAQEVFQAFLACLPETLYHDRDAFVRSIEYVAHATGFPLSSRLREALLKAFAQRDASAEICRDKDGNPEADPALRDTERVPLSERVEAFFEREVKPYSPDAWINPHVRDSHDGQVGIVGVEINLTKLFYRYHPPRPLEEIMADIVALEAESADLLRDLLTGSTSNVRLP